MGYCQRDARITPHIFWYSSVVFPLSLAVGHYGFDVKNAEQSSKNEGYSSVVFPLGFAVGYTASTAIYQKNDFVAAATPRPRRTERVIVYSVLF